ncbi:MAG TPA: hypothetical protein VGR78_00240, partial [Verrucomicrobiae bacterium]|nr:hypothetical protein [Verrucomicrobiae bacterium]
ITVKDTTAPKITGVGGPLTIDCSAPLAFSTPTASDDCSGVASLTSNDMRTDGNCAGNYSITRTWTAIDNCGNTSTASQTITVKDTTPPVISGVGSNKSIECPASPSFSNPTATDNCAGTVSLTYADSKTAICGNSYKITRTWTAKDVCGNVSTASQCITVTDTTAPVITCPPGKTLACGSDSSTANTGTATATDNCSAVAKITITYSDSVTVNASGDTVITRTWKAVDECGNAGTCTQIITVKSGSCEPGSFNLAGNSYTTGTAGNVRTFTTANGVNVKVTAFSRTYGTSGTWAAAYLGSYSGGLGVTDTGEDGSAPNHTLDNVGRNDFLLFEFDQVVTPSSAVLGYVSGDSDMTIFIGTFNNPYANHLTLSDSLISQFGYTEDNNASDGNLRTANFNAGGVSGNVLVIAASLSDTTPDDYFKVQTLGICKPTCTPPMSVCVHKATVGEYCSPGPSNPLNHAMWLPGIGTDFDFIPNPGSFVSGPNGTATLTGTLRSQSSTSKGFNVVVNLTGFTMTAPGPVKKELQSCAYVENGGPIDSSTWVFYTSFTATLTGVDTYAGAVMTLVQTGPAFQVGFGANGKNFDFGASSWFKWTVVKQPSYCAAFPATGQGDFNLDLYNCAQFITYTQSNGWGLDPSGNNPGALLAANFSAVYPGGSVVIGGMKTLTFDTPAAIAIFLPQTAAPNKLTASATDPTSSPAGSLAGEVLALKFNVDFSNKGILPTGFANLKVTTGYKMAGQTISAVLAAANTALGGGALPSGVTSYADLANLLNLINGDFLNGTVNNNVLVP